MSIASDTPTIHYRGRVLDGFDAVVPRIAAGVTFYGAAVVRQFELMGAFCLNGSDAISRSRDKLHCLQLLALKGIGLPVTGFAHSPDDAADLMAMAGGPPLILKLLEGTQGKGVVLAETRKAAESVIEAFRGLNAYFLVQEFIKEAGGTDIRCVVLGGKVIAAMLRRAGDGEFRANLHRGGRAEPIAITDEECDIACRAADIVGLHFAGVDLLRSTKGPVVLEVNSSPGLEGIEATSGKDVAGLVVEWIAAQTAHHGPLRRRPKHVHAERRNGV